MFLALVLAASPPPVVVELYSSEGCSSCPPAEAALSSLAAARPGDVEIIPIELHVDYWNHLGWTDPFSSPRFSADQERVAHKRGWKLYTPMTIVDGTEAFPGGERALRQAVARAAERSKVPVGLRVTGSGDHLTVEVTGERLPHVEVVVLEEGLSTRVPRGENAGRTLVHAPVARWRGTARACPAEEGCWSTGIEVRPGWRKAGVRVVAVARASEDGPVIGAATARPYQASR